MGKAYYNCRTEDDPFVGDDDSVAGILIFEISIFGCGFLLESGW